MTDHACILCRVVCVVIWSVLLATLCCHPLCVASLSVCVAFAVVACGWRNPRNHARLTAATKIRAKNWFLKIANPVNRSLMTRHERTHHSPSKRIRIASNFARLVISFLKIENITKELAATSGFEPLHAKRISSHRQHDVWNINNSRLTP